MTPRGQLLMSGGSGLLFSVAWLLFVDGFVIARQESDKYAGLDVGYSFKHWTPGLVGSIGFVMMNMVTPQMLMSNHEFDDDAVVKAKVWFFFSVLICFTGLILSIWLMIVLLGQDAYADLGTGQTHSPAAEKQTCEWCGVALFLQAILLLISSFLFFSARGKKQSDDIF
eukprot:TRINITY_DN44377_c0_g1_i1.p1 TRINITY_DN44377_c0_g1~~TRINITY_DN44377_c0_g1_i1.p1  ORF type:complete len:190 (+),score=64.76 TRINITY_DN44377_c0_g1_i1:65-571(+)